MGHSGEHFRSRKRLPWLLKKSSSPQSFAPSKNRTTVEVRSRRQRCLTATSLLGLALVRSARAVPPTTGKVSALASLIASV
jgi:hypothetical protein